MIYDTLTALKPHSYLLISFYKENGNKYPAKRKKLADWIFESGSLVKLLKTLTLEKLAVWILESGSMVTFLKSLTLEKLAVWIFESGSMVTLLKRDLIESQSPSS